MKRFLKITFLMISCVSILTSCEKALDNSIPEGTPRRAYYNAEIKKIITNDSLWVTPYLDGGAYKFRIGYLFANDGTCKIVSGVRTPQTVVDQLNAAYAANPTTANRNEINSLLTAFGTLVNNDANLRATLLAPANVSFKNRIEKFFPLTATAPVGNMVLKEEDNTYDVYGNFDSSLTFFNSSVLSTLKQRNLFDFDFLIKSYKRDSLTLEGYYSQNTNRYPTIKPIAVSTFAPHVNAFNLLTNTLAFNTELRVNGVAITTDGNTYLKSRYADGYDNLNKSLVFKSIAGQTIDPLFNGINAIKTISAPFIAGSPKPAVGTVIATFTGYDINIKGSITTGKLVELVVK